MTKHRVDYLPKFHEEMKKYGDRSILIYPYTCTKIEKDSDTKKNELVDYFCLKVESEHLIYDKIVSVRSLEPQKLSLNHKERTRTSTVFARQLDLFYRSMLFHVFLRNPTKKLEHPSKEMTNGEFEFFYELFDRHLL